MQEPGILCVIDMQPYFCAAGHLVLIDSVLNEIKLAIKKGDPIFIVEYLECGPTCADILNAVKGYDHLHFIRKKYDDGSKEIVKYIQQYNSSPRKETTKRKPLTEAQKSIIRICGVNTWACVARTLKGLAKIFPDTKFVVLENACGDDKTGYGHKSTRSISSWLMHAKRDGAIGHNDDQVSPNIVSKRRRICM